MKIFFLSSPDCGIWYEDHKEINDIWKDEKRLSLTGTGTKGDLDIQGRNDWTSRRNRLLYDPNNSLLM